MKKKTISVFAVLALATTMTGCGIRGDFTAISTKNINVSNIKLDKSRNKGRSVGEDCTHIITFIPTGGDPTLDEAIDKALEAKQANLLLDAVVNYDWFYIPYIYGQFCWKAEGVAYDTNED